MEKGMTIFLSGHYSLGENNRTQFPLPYGTYSVNAEVKGNAYSSNGGCWRWNFPELAVVGYGEYNPYINFFFQGQVSVLRKKSIPDGEWGMRIGDRKVIVFHKEGALLYPSDLVRVEGYLRALCPPVLLLEGEAIPMTLNDQTVKQGHLEICEMPTDFKPAPNFSIVGDRFVPGRRKVYNHQFFGDCRIYHVEGGLWLVGCFGNNETKVVSPDHLDEPIELRGDEEGRWYLVGHPLPESGID